MYYVFTIYSAIKDRYFVGYTDDLETMLQTQNQKGFGGMKGDWRLVYDEQLPNKTEAFKRSKELRYNLQRKAVDFSAQNAERTVHPV